MSGIAAEGVPRLSALRLVSFIPAERDAVRVGLLAPDAREVVDLTGLGITDALEAVAQLPMLRQAAGAILHGAARVALPVESVHLVAPLPLVRCVVQDGAGAAPRFLDPDTPHGPGGHVARDAVAGVRVGLGCLVAATLDTGASHDDAAIASALAGSVLVLGWPRADHAHEGSSACTPGALGPYLAVPARRPETLRLTGVAPLAPVVTPDVQHQWPAPAPGQFVALARRALASHTLRPGDLLVIFPVDATPAPAWPAVAGSWLRASAPGLGTLSLAVR